MNSEILEIVFRLIAALAAGGIIGLERSFRGRAAGFRTHALVCLASSLLMLVTVYEHQWFVAQSGSRVVVDPTRMAQGIMTGIGFLGAGVIVKEGLTVRGLTTAASIWVTAAIGILTGIGFYIAAGIGVVLTLGTLSVFRWIEAKVPGEFYAHLRVTFRREHTMNEDELRRFLLEHGFTVANLIYSSDAQAGTFEYRMVIRSRSDNRARGLAEALARSDAIREFRMAPAGD